MAMESDIKRKQDLYNMNRPSSLGRKQDDIIFERDSNQYTFKPDVSHSQRSMKMINNHTMKS